MIVKWVLERDAYKDGNTERMKAICEQNGWLYQEIPPIIFGSDEHIDWDFGPDEAVFVYGTILLCKFIQRKMKWYPGCWADWNTLKCSNYMARWGEHSVHTDYAFLPIAEVKRKWAELFMRYQHDGNIFIKPDDNDKRFDGQLVAGEFGDQWYDAATLYGAGPESMALISKPTRIIAEWRFIIAGKAVATGSLYRADGRTIMSRVDPDWEFDKGAFDFVEKVTRSSSWSPAPMYAFDVALVDDGIDRRYRMMEVGSVNCCGLYRCDIAAYMEAANNLATQEWKDVHDIDAGARAF